MCVSPSLKEKRAILVVSINIEIQFVFSRQVISFQSSINTRDSSFI